MSPNRERKLLESILCLRGRPPKWRPIRATILGTAVWTISFIALVILIGGTKAITLQMCGVFAVAFALGYFTHWDTRRRVADEIWPLYERHLDLDAMERRLNELRT